MSYNNSRPQNSEIAGTPAKGLIGLLWLMIALLVGLILSGSICSLPILQSEGRQAVLLQSIVQNIVAFILPVIFVYSFLGKKWIVEAEIDSKPSMVGIVAVLAIYLVSMPLMAQLIFYNNEIHFPPSLNSLEVQLREWELSAVKSSNMVLNTESIGGLLSGILIVGVLTGFCEEFYFRGGMQKMLITNGINHHIAIWGAAVVFSALHMQFFGFIPRLLLGVFFGYMMFWTHSLWVSAVAHSLNNSVVVVINWLLCNGLIGTDPTEECVSAHGIPVYAITSLLATCILIILFRNKMLNSREKQSI